MPRALGRMVLGVLIATCWGAAAEAGDSAQTSSSQAASTQGNSAPPAQASGSSETLSPEVQQRLIQQVRHQLVMLPYYTVFDNLTFRIDGRTVVLEGQVVNPVNKPDAENAVKRIEGVEKVVNNIEVLPPSPMDARMRQRVYDAIYSYGPLFKYHGGSVPPIHILVKGGRVTLDGVVDNETDKGLAGMRANQVPGVFEVTNQLRVVPVEGKQNKKKK